MLKFTAFYDNGESYTLSDTFSYNNLALDRINHFEVRKDDSLLIDIYLDGNKLVYRRRRQFQPGGNEIVMYIVGWKGKDGESINGIFEDGRIIQFPKFQEKIALLSAPEVQEMETCSKCLSGEKHPEEQQHRFPQHNPQ